MSVPGDNRGYNDAFVIRVYRVYVITTPETQPQTACFRFQDGERGQLR